MSKKQHTMILQSISLFVALFLSSTSYPQQSNTVSYPAEYFAQWNPVTVADMIDRIPGITVALETNTSNRNQNDRGLGSGENILINGQRLSGKDNEARDQLARIAFEQVERIEIIRGTSSDLVGVRNQGQIVNIVTNSLNELSATMAASATRYQDGNLEPGASLFFNGSYGNLDYRIGMESDPQYEVLDSIEESVNGDFSANDLRVFRQITDQTNQTVNSNLSYNISPDQTFTLNLLYQNADPPRDLNRTILQYGTTPPVVRREREIYDATRSNWELGADYNISFADNSRFQFISINNQLDQDTLQGRFRVSADDSILQDLSLRNKSVNTERIFRGVYTRPVSEGHNLELGLERAQTTLATQLDLSRLNPATSQLVEVAVPNALSEIEEIRYEGFAVHHWQLNTRMKLESTLLYEVSEISQTGDIEKSRDFDFIRPKLDYRFDITPGLQFQFSVEKFVAQLSFADFAANTDPRDEERDTVAGNPELRQQQSWRYTANLEYRFHEGRGVVSARAWLWDVTDAIGRVDATRPGEPLVSAAGNIGDGEVRALQINASYRFTPNLLVSGTSLMRASEATDPFLGITRRLVPNDRGYQSVAVRHNLPRWNLNYGIDYLDAPQGNRPLYDINRIDHLDSREDLSFFIERNSIGRLNLLARFDIRNSLDRGMCSDRFRFNDRLSIGTISEVERRCNERGSQYVVQLRGTF
ncbi:MAG: TonB-dependent receptor plug domain-containing protein [Proteobacteria bacterium]|nr:TonB-dependent receptor plug domain-containing protein [Pseudomonadota bacterium]MDA0926575.1 TonB-dependent receptor plug domain-containing protein [Pseudomonadota bacterium]